MSKDFSCIQVGPAKTLQPELHITLKEKLSFLPFPGLEKPPQDSCTACVSVMNISHQSNNKLLELTSSTPVCALTSKNRQQEHQTIRAR